MNTSKECDICHHWHFLNRGFMFEPYRCNGCHDLMQTGVNFNVAIVSVRENCNIRKGKIDTNANKKNSIY